MIKKIKKTKRIIEWINGYRQYITNTETKNIGIFEIKENILWKIKSILNIFLLYMKEEKELECNEFFK